MKATLKLVSLLTVALFAACAVQAQSVYTIATGTTSARGGVIAASVTNTFTTYANCRNTRLATVEWKYELMGAGTTANTIRVYGSLGSTAADAWTYLGGGELPADGTTQVSTNFNVDSSAWILLKFSVENGNAEVVTNQTLRVGVKRGVEPTLPIDVAYGGTGAATAAAALHALGGGTGTNAPTIYNPVIEGYQTNSVLTASRPVWADANKGLSTPTVAAFKTSLGIQAGTCVSAGDGTVTNTFTTAFSAAPIVVSVQMGLKPQAVAQTNCVVKITTTNFVLNVGTSGITNNWIAIGAP